MCKKKKNVCAIIVTYNRKEELLRCVRNILSQTYKPQVIVIVENASTDGTIEYLYENDILKKNDYEKGKLIITNQINEIDIYIYRNKSNSGGSGGFYRGLKLAHEQIGADLFWMMDDDGYPDSCCLEKLVNNSEQFGYIMPVSIDLDNQDCLSWGVRKRNGKKTFSYNELRESWGKIMDYVTPFNGILLSEKCVNDVGYINKDFFLWGDEYDHYWRCREAGYRPVTLMDAVFFHPSQKLPMVKICFGLLEVPYVHSELRMICLARNYTYIYMRYHQKYKIILKFIMYSWLYIFTRKFDMKGYRLYLLSVYDGIIGDFTRHLKYIK